MMKSGADELSLVPSLLRFALHDELFEADKPHPEKRGAPVGGATNKTKHGKHGTKDSPQLILMGHIGSKLPILLELLLS